MARKNTDKQGAAAFDAHFQGVYGDRWPALRAALAVPSQGEELPGLVKPYYLDAASVRAAEALQVRAGDRVADFCAAPGGKTLVLALALRGTGRLVANDRSPDRRLRLRRVVEDHLPPEYRTNLQVTGYDATRWGLAEPSSYDRILLDAPCSSERHVLQSPKHLALWTAHRSKALAQQAVALFCAAIDALKPGGRLVYSTCSISPEENEGLVERMRAKRAGQWRLLEQELELPDTAQGQGPLFRAVVEKLG